MERNRPPIVEKPKPSQSPSLLEQLTSLHQLSEEARKKELWQDEVEIKVQTRGLPFMLLPLSDLHIGSSGVDYDALQRYLDFIKRNPVYTVLVGDLADNFSPQFNLGHLRLRMDMVEVRDLFNDHDLFTQC